MIKDKLKRIAGLEDDKTTGHQSLPRALLRSALIARRRYMAVYQLSEKLRPEDTLFRQFLAEHLEHGLPEAAWVTQVIQQQSRSLGRSARIHLFPHIDRRVVLAYWHYLLLPRLPLKGYWWGIAFHFLTFLLSKATSLHNPYRIVFATEFE